MKHIQDWPPSADFKTTFPELYDDFAQATPVPNYVRRDGVLNIASHFPKNAIAPDLGTTSLLDLLAYLLTGVRSSPSSCLCRPKDVQRAGLV